MPKWPAYLMAAATAACAVPAITMSAPAPSEDYSARGQESDWTLKIADGRIDLVEDSGRTTTVRPEPRTTFNGRRYETARLVVDISHSPCTDSSGDSFAQSVMIVTDRGTLRGCGGQANRPETQA